MTYNKGMRQKILLSLCLSSLLVGCGWVDSTGRNSNSTPVTQISFNDGQVADATQINELSSVLIRADGTDADGVVNSYSWSDAPVEQGALSQCAAATDFDMSIAADSLQDACASSNECALSIEQQPDSIGDGADFVISAPDLRAPVGVTFELTAVDNDGGVGIERSTFCLIAINMAPEALDDSFTVLEGETLQVTGAERNLLSNDSDDVHVQNSPLSVLVNPVRTPALASAFSLNADGGFIYTASSAGITGDTTDTFEYSITDGVHEPVSATVSVRIVASDDPPQLVDEIPMLEAVAGVPFEFDLNRFFEDPEGSDLSYTIVGGALPRSGALELSAIGLLSGTAELFDEGSYSIEVAASDGSSGVSASLELLIAENLPPEATSIASQTAEAGVTFTLDVSDHFEDPENQTLTYSVDTEFTDAQLSMNASTGLLTADFEDDGRFTIDVSADDGVTQATSIRFVVIVTLDNVSPIFRGSIASQTLDQGDLLFPISGLFSDADGDETLEYDVIGNLPTGLSLSAAGVLSGRPTSTGRFAGIRIVATDPFGEFARSNAFTITVLPTTTVASVINTAPEFIEESVFNQGILLGQQITPVQPEFTDAEDDLLRYSVTGNTLPSGVQINSATGVITGTPRVAIWVQGLQVVATDPDGESALSDEFWIRVQ